MPRKRLLFVFIKGVLLLSGVVVLIGGSLFTAALPYIAINIYSLPPFIFFVFITALFLSVLYVWARISHFSQQVKILALLISMLFLVGGDLCFINTQPKHTSINGAFLLSLAITLCGYVLVLWMFNSLKKSLFANPL
jgi:hypothetical protein